MYLDIFLHFQIPPNRKKARDNPEGGSGEKLDEKDKNKVFHESGLNDAHIGRSDHVGSDYFHDWKEKQNGNRGGETAVDYSLENKRQADKVV